MASSLGAGRLSGQYFYAGMPRVTWRIGQQIGQIYSWSSLLARNSGLLRPAIVSHPLVQNIRQVTSITAFWVERICREIQPQNKTRRKREICSRHIASEAGGNTSHPLFRKPAAIPLIVR